MPQQEVSSGRLRTTSTWNLVPTTRWLDGLHRTRFDSNSRPVTLNQPIETHRDDRVADVTYRVGSPVLLEIS